MQITLKMYASLSRYLPSEADGNAVTIEASDDVTPNRLIDEYGVPRAEAHLVLKNGVYVEPRERDEACLDDGDTIALWPPVAGG